MDISKFELTIEELIEVKLQHYTGKRDEARPDIVHFIKEICKAQVFKVLSMLEPVELEPVELKALEDEEMETIVPVFRYDKHWYRAISQATIQHNQAKGQLYRVKEGEGNESK